MNYILVMSLSGSCLFLFYLCLKKLGREYVPIRWKYTLLKICMLYYLLPLSFLKGFYTRIYRELFSYELLESEYIKIENIRIFMGDKIYLNHSYKIQILIFGIWILGAMIFFGVNMIQYIRFRRNIIKDCDRVKDRTIQEQVELLKKEYRIKRNVTLMLSREEFPPFTIGIIKPIIIINQSSLQKNLEFALRHELLHINRYDSLMFMLQFFIQIIHWFNPFIYLLKQELDRICEISCDAAVIKNMSEKHCTEYAQMIVQQGRYGKNNLRWGAALSKDANRIKERIYFIMDIRKNKGKKRKNRWNSIAFGILISLAIFLNSLTVLAYKDVTDLESVFETTEEQIEGKIHSEGIFYLSENEAILFSEETIHYEKQFIDQDGNIFPVENSVQTYLSCSHIYVKGRYQEHIKYSGGKCEVKTYEANRCSKCGRIVKLSLISTTTYNSCPH